MYTFHKCLQPYAIEYEYPPAALQHVLTHFSSIMGTWDRVVHAIPRRILFGGIIVLVNSKLDARTLPHCIAVTLATAAAAVTLPATLAVALIFATLLA